MMEGSRTLDQRTTQAAAPYLVTFRSLAACECVRLRTSYELYSNTPVLTWVASCGPQAYIHSRAPKHVRLQNRPLEHYTFEHGFYATASNRRRYIFPLFRLSADGGRFLKDLEASTVDYDRELLPADRADLEQRFVEAIQQGTFEGSPPGYGRSKVSDLVPQIGAAEDAHAFANGARHTHEPCTVHHRTAHRRAAHLFCR